MLEEMVEDVVKIVEVVKMVLDIHNDEIMMVGEVVVMSEVIVVIDTLE